MTSYETNLFNEFTEMEWLEVELTFESANSWKLNGDCSRCQGAGEVEGFEGGDWEKCQKCYGSGQDVPIYYDNQGIEELIKEYKGE
jgi:hypothetical protein